MYLPRDTKVIESLRWEETIKNKMKKLTTAEPNIVFLNRRMVSFCQEQSVTVQSLPEQARAGIACPAWRHLSNFYSNLSK